MHQTHTKISLGIVAIITLLIGCSSVRPYQEEVKAWQGRSADELLAKWGQPEKSSKQADGGQILTYVTKHLAPPRTINSEGNAVEYITDCKTTFITNAKNVIIRWNYNGNGCAAPVSDNGL